MANRSRDYAPLGLNLAPLPAVDDYHSQYSGEYTQEPNETPDLHHEPYRQDDAPLITSRSRQTLSPENSYDSGKQKHHRDGSGSYPGAGNGISPTFSQQSTIRRKPPHSSSLSSLRSGFFSIPFHKDVEDPKHPYARHYSFRRTRDKLLVRGFKQWILTVVFALAIGGALIGYERHNTIDSAHKHAFNSIITGLSICLGMNLASSLRAYSELMRWRLLSLAWLTLRQFDLVMHCGSLLKICELMIETVSSKFPFISWIHVIGTMWLCFNAAAQVLVAMLGLTYSLDPALATIAVPNQPVYIADLSIIRDFYGSGSGTVFGQMYAAHAYGIQGQDYPSIQVSDPYSYSIGTFGTYTDDSGLFWMYRFINDNAEATGLSAAWMTSDRTINTTAVCVAYNVDSVKGNEYVGFNVSYINNSSQPAVLFVKEAVPGAITWMGDLKYPCGSRRCAHLVGFQMKAESFSPNQQLLVDRSTLFDCINEVSEVTNLTKQGEPYQLPNDQARYMYVFFMIYLFPPRATAPGNINGQDQYAGLRSSIPQIAPASSQFFCYWAGAIGWSGYPVTGLGNTELDEYGLGTQYVVYSNESYWAPPYVLTPEQAATFVMVFTIGGIAAMDNNLRIAMINDTLQPQQALQVTVEWKYTLALLSVIVVLQMIALLLVILWANKSVILDDSHLSISKLLAPTVLKLGNHGSVLRGEEIAEAITDRCSGPRPEEKYKVFYGCRDLTAEDVENGDISFCRDGFGRGIMRAGIIEKGDQIEPKKERPFVDGTYD